MSEITGVTVNALTGEEIVAPLSKDDLDFIKVVSAESEALRLEQEAKITARQSALAKLAALGLTEAEIAAL
jgi:DNA-binding NarL/FixJ family response regulator